MKCPNCDGKGTVLKIIYEDWQKDEIVRSAVKCSRCNGSGEVQMTEQEYLQTCNTEQLAEVFFEYRYANATPQQQLWLSANEDFVKRGIVEWLKQPHTNE